MAEDLCRAGTPGPNPAARAGCRRIVELGWVGLWCGGGASAAMANLYKACFTKAGFALLESVFRKQLIEGLW